MTAVNVLKTSGFFTYNRA